MKFATIGFSGKGLSVHSSFTGDEENKYRHPQQSVSTVGEEPLGKGKERNGYCHRYVLVNKSSLNAKELLKASRYTSKCLENNTQSPLKHWVLEIKILLFTHGSVN